MDAYLTLLNRFGRVRTLKKKKNSTVILASHVPTPFTESNLQIARTDIIGTVQSIDAYGPAN